MFGSNPQSQDQVSPAILTEPARCICISCLDQQLENSLELLKTQWKRFPCPGPLPIQTFHMGTDDMSQSLPFEVM